MAKNRSMEQETDGVDAPTASTMTSIARSIAFLALKMNKETDSKDLLTKVAFLEDQLGLSRADAACVLGSSTESIRVALYNARKKNGKGGRRGGSRN